MEVNCKGIFNVGISLKVIIFRSVDCRWLQKERLILINL